jgi:hypothetical protein
MATLTIDFLPIVNATSYSVCYKPVGAATFTCTSITTPPLIVTGVSCGVSYEVVVETTCDNSLQSVERQVTASQLPCPPPPVCYIVNIKSPQAAGNFIRYEQDGIGIITVPVTSLTLNNNYYIGAFCSNNGATLVDGDNIVQTLVGGSSIATQGVLCTSNTDCESGIIYSLQGVGYGATACTNQTLDVYSDCPQLNIATGCFIYTDAAGGSPLTETPIFISGTLWDVDISTGEITGQNITGC